MPELVASLLASAVSALELPVVLVLDDYHLIENSFIHETMQALLNLGISRFILTIITREDPPYYLSRLRAQQRLLEIRSGELTFSREETEIFFQKTLEIDLPEELVDSVILKTEGWIAALQLCGLTLRTADSERLEQLTGEFGGSSRYIVDYLFEEVMRYQSDDVTRFLHETAALDRLTEELCNDVTGRRDSGSMLRILETENLFLIPLDSQRVWYRYHHLFSSFLRAQTPDEELSAVAGKSGGVVPGQGAQGGGNEIRPALQRPAHGREDDHA